MKIRLTHDIMLNLKDEENIEYDENKYFPAERGKLKIHRDIL